MMHSHSRFHAHRQLKAQEQRRRRMVAYWTWLKAQQDGQDERREPARPVWDKPE